MSLFDFFGGDTKPRRRRPLRPSASSAKQEKPHAIAGGVVIQHNENKGTVTASEIIAEQSVDGEIKISAESHEYIEGAQPRAVDIVENAFIEEEKKIEHHAEMIEENIEREEKRADTIVYSEETFPQLTYAPEITDEEKMKREEQEIEELRNFVNNPAFSVESSSGKKGYKNYEKHHFGCKKCTDHSCEDCVLLDHSASLNNPVLPLGYEISLGHKKHHYSDSHEMSGWQKDKRGWQKDKHGWQKSGCCHKSGCMKCSEGKMMKKSGGDHHKYTSDDISGTKYHEIDAVKTKTPEGTTKVYRNIEIEQLKIDTGLYNELKAIKHRRKSEGSKKKEFKNKPTHVLEHRVSMIEETYEENREKIIKKKLLVDEIKALMKKGKVKYERTVYYTRALWDKYSLKYLFLKDKYITYHMDELSNPSLNITKFKIESDLEIISKFCYNHAKYELELQKKKHEGDVYQNLIMRLQTIAKVAIAFSHFDGTDMRKKESVKTWVQMKKQELDDWKRMTNVEEKERIKQKLTAQIEAQEKDIYLD